MTIKIFTEDERKAQRKLTKEVCKLSVAEIATNLYGLSLYSDPMDRRYVRCYEHSGLNIDMSNNLASFNGIDNLNGYDFIACYEKISSIEAREKLNEYYKERDPRKLLMYYYSKQKNQVYEYNGLFLPKKGKDTSQLVEFLNGKGIDNDTINNLLDAGLIYQDEIWNRVVFVGFDENDNPAFGCAYSTSGKEFKQDCNGSFDKVGWGRINENSDTVIVCASPMEAIAYLSIDDNASVFCSKNKNTLIDTLAYAKDKYQWFENVSNLKIAINIESKQDQKLYDTCKLITEHTGDADRKVDLITVDEIFDLYYEGLEDDYKKEVDLGQLKDVKYKSSILTYLKDLDDKVEESVEEQNIGERDL